MQRLLEELKESEDDQCGRTECEGAVGDMGGSDAMRGWRWNRS